jgi:hypothetical protein
MRVESKSLGEKRPVLCAKEHALRLEPTNEGSVTGNETRSLQMHEVEKKGKN